MAMRVAGSGKKAGAAFGGAVAGAELVLAVGGTLLVVVGLALGGGSAAAGGEASAGGGRSCDEGGCMCFLDSSPSESSKNSFPSSSAIYVTDRVLKQLVKNLVFTFEFFSREKCAVLRVVGLYRYTCTATFSSCAIILLV